MSREYVSRYRVWILRYFAEHADERISAGDLHRRMMEEGMHVNLTTVYRNLERLEEEKKISRQKMPEEEEHLYRYMKPGMACGTHLHLYCERCGRVIHLNCGFMDEITEHLLRKHGFSINCGQSMLTGLCADCREKERNRTE